MSFFNEGPQPSINSNNGVRFIDPNPTNQTVNHEDLVMYVKLIARSKGRSIVTADSSEDDLNGEDVFSNVVAETNFTYPEGKSFLDTSWTNIGGGNINLGENLGTFGITNINIEFKSSFMPQITIDFVDVRGSALFEQGPCSPYSFFFHLPYPVFELTVKGYYGKPVTYTLALTKFNTKFNAETGNFESKGEFVGYTYAFLADLPLGYIMASTYMAGGTEILAQKWEKVVIKQNAEGNVDGSKQLDPSKPFTIFDMIVNSKKLETELPKYKNDVGIKQLSQLSKSIQALNDLKQTLTEYQRKIKSISGMKVKEGSSGKKTKFYSDNTANIDEVNEQNKIYIASTPTDSNTFSAGKISSKQNIVNSYLKLANIDELDIKFDDIKNNSSGFFVEKPFIFDVPVEDEEYYIDTEILLNKIETKTTEVEKKYKAKKKDVQGQLNGVVRQELGFWPSIRNVFTILTTNTEVFLELLANTSAEAEKYHKDEELDGVPLLENKNKTQGPQSSTETNKVKIYPWPTYYEDETLGGEGQKNEVEKYPGVNTSLLGWPEVRFVEDFVNALTKLRSDLDRFVSDDTQNEPGFDNFVPITAYETHVMGESRAPNRWIGIEQGIKGLKNLESVWCLMGETAFLLGDYSMINSLSVWKSQLGFDNTWSNTNGPDRFESNPSIDTNKSNLGRWDNKGFDFTKDNYNSDSGTFKGKISPTTITRMRQWGKVDALNMLSTLGSDEQNELLIQIRGAIEGDKTTIKAKIKENIKKALKKKYKENYKNRNWDTWKADVTKDLGLSSQLYISKQDIWNSNGVYGYVKKDGNPILSLRFDTKDGIPLNHSSSLTPTKIHPNPHNNLNGGVRLVDDNTITSREINFDTTLIDRLKTLYNEYFGENNNTNNSITTDETGTQQNLNNVSISKLVLKNRPHIKDKNNYWTPYSDKGELENSVMKVHTNLNMLSYDFESYRTLFYRTYEDSQGLLVEDEDDTQLIFDLGSPTIIYDHIAREQKYYFNRVSYEDGYVENPIFQNPLWTINYPPHKNPFYGTSTFIGNDEIVEINIETKKPSIREYTKEPINLENGDENTTRNFATWWGLNQYYTSQQDVNSYKYLLPLAYLTVMSFGFESINYDKPEKLGQWTGHFIPFDGLESTSTSSFSNFTHSHVVAEPPKSWLLLLGSILWRAKEGGVLDNQYDNLKPTYTHGWNKDDLSVGVNDDNDAVWFFHTPLSKPWWLGGSVFAINNNTTSIVGSYFIDLTWNNNVTRRYQRRYLGYGTDNKDRWTSSVGGGLYNKDINDFDNSNRPRVIGPWKSGQSGSMTNYVGGADFTWFGENNINDEWWSYKNIGPFSICSKEQVPFLYPNPQKNQYESRPKTLTLKKDDPKNGEYINIKENMKELMFLPSNFKKSLIDYFEKWGSNSGLAFNETNGWLSTLDPLNWVPNSGLPKYQNHYKNEWWTYDGQYQNGYGGYLGKDRITSLLSGEVLGANNGTPNGIFTEDTQNYNLWFMSYGNYEIN